VSPQNGNPHVCTLIYLHGFCGHAKEYLDGDTDWCLPWRLGHDYAPGLRVVLPTAPQLRQPWGEVRSSWYTYASRKRNGIGNTDSLAITRDRLVQLLQVEVERLGDPSRVFLGGLSQGCTVALDVYLREAPRLGLGGFVGSVGFLPSDGLGFPGADDALRGLLADGRQASRPVWLLCATDDCSDVPWSLVRRSLRQVKGNLPGLVIREVRGRGHHVDEWEVDLLNEFLREHAKGAYF